MCGTESDLIINASESDCAVRPPMYLGKCHYCPRKTDHDGTARAEVQERLTCIGKFCCIINTEDTDFQAQSSLE